jgi:hypothetical protein
VPEHRSISRRAARCGWAIPAAILVALVAGHAAAAEQAAPYRPDEKKVVIPFDFESKFDKGRYGEMVGDMVWKKLQRQGGVVIPEAMADVRDFCTTNKIALTPDTPLETVRKVIREDFDAHIGIWGSVERVPPNDTDVYDLVIKCVDFSGAEPKVIYECKVQTKTVSEIPHLYLKEMLDKLYDRQPGGPVPLDQMAEENWKKNPSLVVGDFESGAGGVPKGWDRFGGQQREPLGNLVKWIPEAGNPKNHVVRFTFPASVGDAEGVMYYSEYFPVEQGAKYRFQVRWRSTGPAGKIFIKCGEPIDTGYKEESKAYRPAKSGSSRAYRPEEGQLREVYRSQMNLKGPNNTWNTHTEEFTPKHTKYTPRYGRVMLYAYLGAGVVEFDDVVLKQVVPPSPSDSVKDPRHSLETKVTMKEMEENERRSKEFDEEKRREREERARKGRSKTKPKAADDDESN